MQQNHAIAVIIIVLFVVITGLSYGIYRLIQAGRNQGSTTATSTDLADDDDSSLARLVDPRPPNIPPDVVPQRFPRRPPGPRAPPPPAQMVQIQRWLDQPGDRSVSPLEADPLLPRPPPNPTAPPAAVVQPAAPWPRPNARRRNPPPVNQQPPMVITPPPPVPQPLPDPPPPPVYQPQPPVRRPRANQPRPRAPPAIPQPPPEDPPQTQVPVPLPPAPSQEPSPPPPASRARPRVAHSTVAHSSAAHSRIGRSAAARSNQARSNPRSRSRPLIHQAPPPVQHLPSRHGSRSASSRGSPQRVPGPGPGPDPPAPTYAEAEPMPEMQPIPEMAPVAGMEPIAEVQPMPGAMPEEQEQAQPDEVPIVVNVRPEPEQHDFVAELPANERVVRGRFPPGPASNAGTSRRHARQRNRPQIMGAIRFFGGTNRRAMRPVAETGLAILPLFHGGPPRRNNPANVADNQQQGDVHQENDVVPWDDE